MAHRTECVWKCVENKLVKGDRVDFLTMYGGREHKSLPTTATGIADQNRISSFCCQEGMDYYILHGDDGTSFVFVGYAVVLQNKPPHNCHETCASTLSLHRAKNIIIPNSREIKQEQEQVFHPQFSPHQDLDL